MLTEATIATVGVAVGGIAAAITSYYKNKKTNGHATPIPKVCAKHEAMAQDVSEIKTTLKTHGATITDIGRSTARIEGLLEGMARKK